MVIPNVPYKATEKVVKEAGFYWGSIIQDYIFYDGKSDFVETPREGKIKKCAYGVNKVRAITQDELNNTISGLENKLRWFKRCQGLLRGNKNP